MTKEEIQQHINFLQDSILNKVSGKTSTYRNGKNKAIRDAAGRILDESCNTAEHYLDRNQSLFDFMVSYHGCDPNYLEYPEWNHIEKDTALYLVALKDKLNELP